MPSFHCTSCSYNYGQHTSGVKEGNLVLYCPHSLTNTFSPTLYYKERYMRGEENISPETINRVGIKDDEVIAAGGTQFETGAVRSADKNHVMYQLISPIGMRRMAETMKEGFNKYGAYNWERGMPIGDLLNHAIAHIYAFLSGIPSVDAKTGKVEDDLAHAAWNLFAAMHIEETHPELDHGLRPTKDAKPTQS